MKINQGHAVVAVIVAIAIAVFGYGFVKNRMSGSVTENATTKVFPPPGTPFMNNSAFANASSPTSFGHKADGAGSGCGCSSKRGQITV